jgi:hypothetical protein
MVDTYGLQRARRVDDDGPECSLVVKEQVEIASLAMLGIEANERTTARQRPLGAQRGKRHQNALLYRR